MPLPAPDPVWAPAFFTPSRYDVSGGEDVADFAETLLTVPKGKLANEPLAFMNWQRWLTRQLLERRPDGFLRYSVGLIGLGRKNGKSLLGTSLALDHLFFGPKGGEVYSAAKDRMQARIVFGEARKQVLASDPLQRVAKVYRDAIEVPARNSVYRALSADGGAAQGLNPSLVIADEIHVWPSGPNSRAGDDLWEALTLGSGAREEALVVAITTAGSTLDSLLGRLYEYGLKVASGELEDETFGMWWWSAPEDCEIRDPDAWRAANPNLAEGLLRDSDLDSASRQIAWPAFRRYRLNQWVNMSGEGLVPPQHWKAAEQADGRIAAGARVTLGFDGSISDDATALVAVDVDSGLHELLAMWEVDTTDPDWTAPRDEAEAAVMRAFERFDVQLMFADPAFWETEIEDWSRRWRGKVERLPMTNQRVAPMVSQWLADLAEQRISHGGQPSLTRHAMNALVKDTPSGVTFTKKRGSPRKVDAFAAAVLANGARHEILAADERKARRGRNKVIVV